MISNARVAALSEILHVGTVVVPVAVDSDGAYVAESIPSTIGVHTIPRVLAASWCSSHGLTEKVASTAVLSGLEGPSVVFVSITSYHDLESLRLAAAAGVANAHGGSLAILLPTEAADRVADAAQAFVEGALLAAYNYKKPEADAELFIVATGVPLPTITAHEEATTGTHRGTVIASNTNWVKRLVDSPPNAMNPKGLAKAVAAHLDTLEHVHVDVWTEAVIREERLGAVLAVASGSAEPPRLVRATYTPPNPVAHIALVGKGITFDSGGLNIKPLASMMEMKVDMSGAAIVSGVIATAAALQLPVQITMIAPMVENLLGDKAVKPSDVVVARSGKTIEVLNPDAEGRLILADGLTLAVEAAPDVIFDVATLTGAMATALGDQCAGFFASTEELAKRVLDASAETGESFWPMPLFAAYEKDIASDVADIKNMGKMGGRGGAIAAALFLQHFTEGLPWAHLDIAGPASTSSAHGYHSKGSTAWGMRTLVSLLAAVVREAKG